MVAEVKLLVLLLVVRPPVVILATPKFVIRAAIFFAMSKDSALETSSGIWSDSKFRRSVLANTFGLY